MPSLHCSPKEGMRPLTYPMPVGPSEELGRRVAGDRQTSTGNAGLLHGWEARGWRAAGRGPRGPARRRSGTRRTATCARACRWQHRGRAGPSKIAGGGVLLNNALSNGGGAGTEGGRGHIVRAARVSRAMSAIRAGLGSEVADRYLEMWGLGAGGRHCTVLYATVRGGRRAPRPPDHGQRAPTRSSTAATSEPWWHAPARPQPLAAPPRAAH